MPFGPKSPPNLWKLPHALQLALERPRSQRGPAKEFHRGHQPSPPCALRHRRKKQRFTASEPSESDQSQTLPDTPDGTSIYADQATPEINRPHPASGEISTLLLRVTLAIGGHKLGTNMRILHYPGQQKEMVLGGLVRRFLSFCWPFSTLMGRFASLAPKSYKLES